MSTVQSLSINNQPLLCKYHEKKVDQKVSKLDFLAIDEKSLSHLLQSCNIETKEWSKSVKDLAKEINSGETKLTVLLPRNEKDEFRWDQAKVERSVNTVFIKVCYEGSDKKFLLTEATQKFYTDGKFEKERQRGNDFIGEKMLPTETEDEAAIRGVKEELGLEVDQKRLKKESLDTKSSQSLSYPNVKSTYNIFKYTLKLSQKEFDAHQDGFIEDQREGGTGKITEFKWKKL